MSNFPFSDPITIQHVDLDDLETLLEGFEETWASNHDGDRVDSKTFYARYTAGEIDSIFAVSWATYYEAACELRRRRDRHIGSLPGELLSAAG